MIRPAQTFLARGGSGKKMPREVAEDVHLKCRPVVILLFETLY